jgi:hypothetical protein
MGKPIQTVMTRGVERLDLPPHVLRTLFDKAIANKDKSPFISFQPKNGRVEITDGNDKILDTVNLHLPEKIWVIFDNYGDYLVATALLPREY